MNAKIWVINLSYAIIISLLHSLSNAHSIKQAETLINEENLIPCFDIVSIMCDQLNGRLKTIEKFGPPKDMD